MKTYDCNDSGWDVPQEKKRPPYAMPLLYHVCEKDTKGNIGKLDKVIVKIALYDMSIYDHSWWGSEDDKVVLVPDVDLTLEEYEFPPGTQAMDFVRKWWCEKGEIS